MDNTWIELQWADNQGFKNPPPMDNTWIESQWTDNQSFTNKMLVVQQALKASQSALRGFQPRSIILLLPAITM